MATRPGDSARDMADAPLAIDPSEFQGIVADAFNGRLNKLNGSVTITADVLDELKEVAAEAIEEAQKLDAAEKALDDAYAADQSDQETYDKGVQEAKDALVAAQAEYDRREKELLAKLNDILAKIIGIGGEDGDPWNSDRWDEDDNPTKPMSKEGSPSDKPSSDSPGDSPSSDNPSGQTQLSSDTATPTQQQAYPNVTPQQAQQQQQPAGMSPSMGMPQSQSPSSSLSSPRPRSDKDKDTRKDSDIDRGVLPVAAPVATPVPIDRGTSGTGITNRDVSGKPSTSLSTSGQVPGAANANNVRGGGVGGGMMGGAPIGGGSKADTASKRNGKNFDIDRLLSKPDDDNQSVNSGSLSRDSLAASDKAEETEQDRVYKAMRDSVKRMMSDKKAG
ncbi:MAG: hypothetical protein KDB26_09680 [Microthrixaceae bacterium]|nr:hypothetical protein [Microthrixaceae bacterium]